MTKFYLLFGFLAVFFFGLSAGETAAQSAETYTGTIISYGSGFNTRTSTSTFTLYINSYTSDADAQKNLLNLQENGQDSLLKSINDNELGRFSIGANVGIPINVVRANDVDGKRRIFIVFERYTRFGELRGGYRSLDYPFGVIELYIDPKTGKGDGTYIAAARIRFTTDKKTNQNQVEIENFATYPARLLGVTLRGTKTR